MIKSFLVVVKYLQKILNRFQNYLHTLVDKDYNVKLLSIHEIPKRNKLIFLFTCEESNVYYLDALESIVNQMNKHPSFIHYSLDKVFIISTSYSSGHEFSFCHNYKTINGFIPDTFIKMVSNKITPQYLNENYGSIEDFKVYKVVVRKVLKI